MERVARTRFQRVIYSEVYACTACGTCISLYHHLIAAVFVNNYRFIFSRYSHCVSCGSAAVDPGHRAYFLSKNPLGWIQLLAAEPLVEAGRRRIVIVAARDLAALSRAIPQAPSEHAPKLGVQDSERPFRNAKER
jgi:hypothetical protein